MLERPATIVTQTDPRFLARIAVFHGTGQKKLITDYTVNISTGGVFLETTKILPLDAPLTIKFSLPDTERIITCTARVAWKNDPVALKKPSFPPGMGIQFLDLSPDDFQSIRLFIIKGDLIAIW